MHVEISRRIGVPLVELMCRQPHVEHKELAGLSWLFDCHGFVTGPAQRLKLPPACWQQLVQCIYCQPAYAYTRVFHMSAMAQV